MKTALVTGASGQDGHYLSSLLLEQGYRVVGTVRSADHIPHRVQRLQARGLEIIALDIRDPVAIRRALDAHQPDEIYNLAAHARGSTMWDEPADVTLTNGLAVTHFLEAIRLSGNPVRFCQASSSEMFGNARSCPQSEQSTFSPRSPYGAAKLYAHHMIGIYRAHHGVFACSAILFNHESPLRSRDFVTGKIACSAAAIKLGKLAKLSLGNTEVSRDWGFAGDYMRAMWMMLQHESAEDFVVASGESHTVAEFCEHAFSRVGLDYREYLVSDPAAFRPAEAVPLRGDAQRIRDMLGWRPEKSFQQLVYDMVDHQLTELSGMNHSE